MEGCKRPQRTYICHIYIDICVYISKTYIDAEFDVKSFGMVYLASKGRLGKVICEKHTFLNVCYRSTVSESARVEKLEQRVRRPIFSVVEISLVVDKTTLLGVLLTRWR